MSGNSLDLLETEKNISSFDTTEFEDEILEPWETLLHHLNPRNIEDLRYFFKDEIDNSELQLNKDQFVYAIDTVLGNSRYSFQAISFFNEIPYPEEDKITWSQFLDYYVSHAVSEQKEKIEFLEPEIFIVHHVEREAIVKIVSIETDTSFCYAVISKYGKIGLYTGDFNLLQQYQVIFTRCDKRLTAKYKRIKSMWVTDAIFIPNENIFAVSNTARSIMFYDASGQKHIPMWLIEGIPNAIYCMQYCFDANLKLFLGDDKGSIIIINCLNKKNGLFRKKYSDRMSHFYWIELKSETDFVQIETYKKIHNNLILKMVLYPETFSIISCSRDNKNSVVFFNLKEKKKTYTFKISQGVCCFSLNHRLHILLTGSDNGTIELWNLYVSSKATTVFRGHKSAIVDLQILAFMNAVLSCSRDGVLKIWNLQTEICDQTIALNFPCFDVLGKLIEWGTCSIFPGPKRLENMEVKEKSTDDTFSKCVQQISNQMETKQKQDVWQRFPILITCCNFLAKLSFQYDDFCSNILPPPPLQNDIIIPEDWRIDEPKIIERSSSPEPELEEEFNMENISPALKDIIKKDFLKMFPNLKHTMNYKIAALERKRLEMINPVRQCAPYLALDLYHVEEVKLSSNLPIPQSRKTQHIIERTQRLLSAASAKSLILSDRSSKSRSSRSSVVEF